MSLPKTTIEELISNVHLNAIVASCGQSCSPVTPDFGTDFTIRQVADKSGKRIDWGPSYDVQLKATINWTENDDEIIYDMDADAYNRLALRNSSGTSTIPCYLILCCLPRNECQWVDVSESELTLRKCCYYELVKGPATTNKSKIRVRIPRHQLFTPDTSIKICNDVLSGVLL